MRLSAEVAGLLAGGMAVLALILVQRKRKAARKKKKTYYKPRPLDDFPQFKPGNGAPIFHGVRVVELSTMVAAPAATRVMADLGAEVVKVEEPKGDYWRQFFLDFETERDFGSAFEGVNLGKRSIVLNLREPLPREQLLRLLEGADVFVTNLRLEAMVRMGLDFETIHKKFPWLVYANLSAWGTTGPDKNLPGYDVGPYWASSGMSASIQPQGSYQAYPVGFGDATSGLNLLAGVAVALAHRLQTGEGLFVDAALLRVGFWTMAPFILPEAKIKEGEVPAYTRPFSTNPLWSTYGTKEGDYVALLHQDSGEAEELKLMTILGLTGEALRGDVCSAVSQACARLKTAELEERLNRARIGHVKMNSFVEVFLGELPLCESAKCFVHVDGITDVPKFPRIPMEFSCSSLHGPQGRAPLLGEHTGSFLRRGFSPVLPEADLKQAPPALPKTDQTKGLLHHITVLELSDCGACVPATGAQLADYGATVTIVEPPEGSFWRPRDPVFFNHLNRGKRSVIVDYLRHPSSPEVHAHLHRLLEGVDVFLTSLPLSKLKTLTMDYDTLHAKYPRLIYAVVTPWGLEGPEVNRGDLGAFWCFSGLAALLGGRKPSPPPPLPLQMGELMGSIYLMAALGAALFHLYRTAEGQRVDINLLHVATWCNAILGSLVQKDPPKVVIFDRPPQERRNDWPVPTANCFRTKDGMWLQMLGVELPRHLMKTLRGLGIRWRVFPMVLWEVLRSVLPATGVPLIFRLTPVFTVINAEMTRAISALTWVEAQTLLREKDIWYCPVQTPAQAGQSLQAHSTGTFAPTTAGRVLAAPLFFSSSSNVVASPLTPLTGPCLPRPYPAAPKLGQHQHLLAQGAV
eukprot:RCo016069